MKREDGAFFLSPGKGTVSQICHFPALHSLAGSALDISPVVVQTPSFQP